MTKKELALEKARQRRAELSALSRTVQPLVAEGVFASVNEGLKKLYFGEDIPQLNTFHGWKQDGYYIRKGEHAFLFWGSPLDIPNELDTEHNNDDPDKAKIEFFPVCHLFSEFQVVPAQKGD